MALAGSGLGKAALFGAAFLFLAGGCAGPEAFGGSRQAVADWGRERGFTERTLTAGNFHLLALSRGTPAKTLTIYIEGDGAPWATPWHPPRDPTPLKPVALALAAADPAPVVAYLGRPCQYLDAAELAACDSAYWIGRRFSPEVVSAYDEAVTRLKASAGAERVVLVGYSGGGVVAALVAAGRRDVARLITVAAPLALGAWVAHHGISPLAGSIDPMDVAGPLPPAVHFVGGGDKTVPVEVVAAFVARRGGRQETVAGFDHECCWTRDWPVLLPRALVGEEEK